MRTNEFDPHNLNIIPESGNKAVFILSYIENDTCITYIIRSFEISNDLSRTLINTSTYSFVPTFQTRCRIRVFRPKLFQCLNSYDSHAQWGND